MPEITRHRPPSLKLSNDDAKNDVLLRIVSPMDTHNLSEDMKNTMRMSESIKKRQSSIIASKNYWNDVDTLADDSRLERDQPSSPASSEANKGDLDRRESGLTDEKSPENTAVNSAMNSGVSTASSSTTRFADIKVKKESDNDDSPKSAPCTSTQLSPGISHSTLDRLASQFQKRSLKRSHAPRPLKLPHNPAVGSGPYTAAHGYYGMPAAHYPAGLNTAPLRPYFYNGVRMGQRFRPRTFVPLSAQYMMVQTPFRRDIPTGSDRRIQRPLQTSAPAPPTVSVTPPQPAAAYPVTQNTSQTTQNSSQDRQPPMIPDAQMKRSRPVQDVFKDNVKRIAPLPLQPPLAQRERFSQVASDDRGDATEEEMEEMRRKWEDGEEIFGSMSFMDKKTFRFKILKKSLSLDEKKAKFMQICETTWDEFMKARKDA